SVGANLEMPDRISTHRATGSEASPMPFVTRPSQPELHYELDDYTDPWRAAPYLILQHGYGRSGRFWYSWVPYLARFYKVVRPDVRGLGRSAAQFRSRACIHLRELHRRSRRTSGL